MKRIIPVLALLLGSWAAFGFANSAWAQFTVNDGTARGTCTQASFQNGSLVLSPAGCLGSTAPPPNDPVFTVRFATSAGTQPAAGAGASAPVFVYVDSDRDLAVGATYNMSFNLCLSTQGCNPSSGAFYFFRYGGLGGTGFTEADKRSTLNQPFTFIPGEGTSPTNLRSMLVGGLHLTDIPAFSGTVPVTASLGGANASAAVSTFTITGSVAGSPATYAWAAPKAKQRTENAPPNWGNGQLMEDFTISRSNANGLPSQVIIELCRDAVACNATAGVNFQMTDPDLQAYFASAGITTLVPNKKFAVNFGATETTKLFFVQVLNSTESTSPTLTVELQSSTGTVLDTATLGITDKGGGGGSCTAGVDANGACIPNPTGPAGTSMLCQYGNLTPRPGTGTGPCGAYELPATTVATCSTGMTGANAIVKAWQYNLEDFTSQPASTRFGNPIIVGVPKNHAMVFRFKTGPDATFPEFAGVPYYRSLGFQMESQSSHGPSANRFTSISETPCDFRYERTIPSGVYDACFATQAGPDTSGNVLARIWAPGREPAPGSYDGFCPLKPNTVYYFNMRYENASSVGTRGVISCDPSVYPTCGQVITIN